MVARGLSSFVDKGEFARVNVVVSMSTPPTPPPVTRDLLRAPGSFIITKFLVASDNFQSASVGVLELMSAFPVPGVIRGERVDVASSDWVAGAGVIVTLVDCINE